MGNQSSFLDCTPRPPERPNNTTGKDFISPVYRNSSAAYPYRVDHLLAQDAVPSSKHRKLTSTPEDLGISRAQSAPTHESRGLSPFLILGSEGSGPLQREDYAASARIHEVVAMGDAELLERILSSCSNLNIDARDTKVR
jgi:hypothetical protein